MKVLRVFPVLALAAALVLPMGMPLCFTEACPMSAADREDCKAMGRDCCETQGGQLSHGPNLPPPTLASIPASPALIAPPHARGTSPELAGPAAAPAVLQGVGLFTLFAVFLI